MSHYDDLERVLHKLPQIAQRCAICEDIRAIPRLAKYYPDPVPAVLCDVLTNEHLCARCASEYMLINAIRRYSIELAVRRRLRRMARSWVVLRLTVHVQGDRR